MTVRKNSRLVIDTNIWISFLIGRSFKKLETLLLEKNCVVLYSQELLDELIEVIKRPKFTKYFDKSSIRAVKSILDDAGEFIRVSSVVEVCRDSKDDFLLALCKDGQADYLITSDNDLLVLKKFYDTKIISYRKVNG